MVLLPRIRTLGDVDEEASFFAEFSQFGGEALLGLEMPAAIGGFERRLIMMELVLNWSETKACAAAATPAQAASLAADLINLMDMADTEQADLAELDVLVPDRFAAHWQDTIEFLKIVTEQWPRILEERGVMSPYARRNLLMSAEAERLTDFPPDHPIIAAGSTGSIPATARLLGAIARAPLGAAVLPGLDLELDDESWRAIADGHPEHPQFGMQQLLERIGAGRDDVAYLKGSEPDARARARLKLISETMRPAGATERWQALRHDEQRAALRGGVPGIAKIEAPNAEDEAEAVALILRQAMESPGKTAALVTPDRTLARRVSTRLKSWGMAIDDSAGKPLAKTPPGVFMELVAKTVHSGFAPVALLALLKHPLARLRRPSAAARGAARALEIAAFRGAVFAEGLRGVRRALKRAQGRLAEGAVREVAIARLGEDALGDADALLDDVEAAFAPLAALYRGRQRHAIKDFVAAHIAVAKELARDEVGEADQLWRDEAGEALDLTLAEILGAEAAGPRIAAADYAEVYRMLTAAPLVREPRGVQPRAFIWGLLEARVQRADVVVLGGLNEGTWPRTEDVDSWFSRPMRETLKLPQPERRLGLSAHDVAQLLGADQVYLTRALKIDGVPTVPSRWLLRLEAVLAGLGVESALEPDHPWIGWVRDRDRVDTYAATVRPAPCPPLEARPRRLSVTRIEEWIANPYAIFARDILRLEPLGDLAAPPDAAMRGQLVHEALRRFGGRYPEALPDDCVGEVMAIANNLFDEIGAHASVRAFWRPQFERFAQWFAVTEPARRAGVTRSLCEVRGQLKIDSPAGPFMLRARADRIDIRGDGRLAIYDYKTGQPPGPGDVNAKRAPQLPLEAAIAAAGGFEGVEMGIVAKLSYIWASGGRVTGDERTAGGLPPEQLALSVLADLRMLVAEFDQPETPYPALRRRQFKRKYDYDDYAHLARAAEWSQSGDGE